MRILTDTNVLLDVLAEREHFYEHSSSIWTLSEKGHLEGLVAAVSFTTVFYLMQKWADADAAREGVTLVRDAFTPVPCDGRIINQAIDSNLPDFEDAVQYFSALHADADCILTRNVKDFPRRSALPILTPAEFMAEHESD